MAAYTIVKLYITDPIALSSDRSDDFLDEVSVLPSDMLKAVLVSTAALLGDENLTGNINQNLIVSSAFPFFNDQLLFPKPYLKSPFKELDENAPLKPGERKKIKKVQFIDQKIFEHYISGKQLSINNLTALQNGKILISNKNGIKGSEKIFISQTAERVTLGCKPFLGTEEKGDPYYVTRTYFNNGKNLKSGFWFIWKGVNKEELEKILEILQDTGIGADKNVGHGRFTFEFSQLELQEPENVSGKMLLSKFIPKQDEIGNLNLEESFYNLTRRGGYMAGASDESKRHWQRKYIWMFDEGSVFKTTEKLNGNNISISESNVGHQVFRDGRPIAIPVFIQEN